MSTYIQDPFSDPDDCPNFYVTVNESEPCQVLWRDYYPPGVLLGIRVGMGTLAATLLAISLYLVGKTYRKKSSNSSKTRFKNGALYSVALGMASLLLFYILGNNTLYPLDTVLGIVSYGAVMYGSVLIFQACAFLLLLIQQVFLSSCGGNLQVHIVKTTKPVVLFILPYYFTSTLGVVLCLSGKIDPVDALFPTRLGLAGVIIPIIVYAFQMSYYGSPVVRAMLDSAEKMEETIGEPQTAMREKAQYLQKQIAFAWISTATTLVIFSTFCFTPITNNPIVFLTFQTYLCFLLLLGSTGVLVVLFREGKKKSGSTLNTASSFQSLNNSSNMNGGASDVGTTYRSYRSNRSLV